MTLKTVRITVELTPFQAEELAQFLKRVTWNEVRQNATGDDEADQMIQALGHVQGALAEVGYAPR